MSETSIVTPGTSWRRRMRELGPYVRPTVSGAVEGFIGSLAMLAGAFGASPADSHAAVVAGALGLLGGTWGHAFSEFAGVDAQTAHDHTRAAPGHASHSHVGHGHTGSSGPAHAGNGASGPSARRAAVVSTVAMLASSAVPLATFLVTASPVAALAAGGVGLFALGAGIGRFTHRSAWRTGLRHMLSGGLAAGFNFAVGSAVAVVAGGPAVGVAAMALLGAATAVALRVRRRRKFTVEAAPPPHSSGGIGVEPRPPAGATRRRPTPLGPLPTVARSALP